MSSSSQTGNRVRELREAKDLRLEDLAARTGLSLWTIHRTEHGYTTPSRRTKEALAKALRVSVADLFERESA